MLSRKRTLKRIFLFLAFLIITSCHDENDLIDSKPIQTDAKKEDLMGVWSIFKVEYNGKTASVPPNFEDCGRDFFIYGNNNNYQEALFQQSSCIPTQNNYKWDLNKGLLTLTNPSNGDFESLKINSLNKDTFIFSADIDLDGDNVNEEYTFTAYRYTPPKEIDVYSSTFLRREEEPFSNRIEFMWNKYNGYNTFVKYEILRSNTSDCSIASAELIKTITDVNTVNFIDETPPSNGNICYFLRVYTNKGLLGESNPQYVNPEFITPNNVDFKNTSNTDNSVTVSWQKYTGYYFSHYEIKVQDQNENGSYNSEDVVIIKDINTTSFTDNNPPYVNNPVYSIQVHNIFGGISFIDVYKNKIKTKFTRPEILPFDHIKFLTFDTNDQSFFFYAKMPDNEYRLVKYNYINKEITAEAFKLPSTYTSVEMKLTSSDHGKELVFYQNSQLWVYDSENLTFKYSLDLGYLPADSFNYLGNNIWIVSDSDKVYTFKREKENSLLKLDEKLHFSDHQGSGNYELTVINKNNVLLSHNNEGRAIHYTIDNEGYITNNGVKEISLKAKYNSDLQVNSSASLLLNKQLNTVYNSSDFSLEFNYSIPMVTSNLNQSGTKIYGTNNIRNAQNSDEEFKKELLIYDIATKDYIPRDTKGYPLYIIDDNSKNIISLSSGFKRDQYYDTHHGNEPDLFIEIIE